MSNFDQLGSFYLGRRHDLANGETLAEPLVYESKHLTTHAVCVGMTGSGKTALCISLLEEAALDGIPAIVIDPKGDLGNLLLAFPKLEPSDFRPWIDESEAARQQMSPDEYGANQAELWRTGLAKWDEGPDRIRRYCDAAERVIYTPGSNAGIPITVLKSFRAPPAALVADGEAFSERIAAAASGLLALLGIDADPVRSREHILISKVLESVWRNGQDVDLRQLIQHIQKPPFDTIGVIDLESFYPAAERYKLAMSINNLLASPSFANWLEGEPLDIARMLYTPAGKPRLAIFSIAHLDEAQRMFFVTILLNEVLAWIRTQPGTSSLRALLYMDEVYGYFPPLANPPAKRPMLTLLKQARAYGLGCILATQNPVDLDYKGLSNAGTWFLGRLQTERDKARVVEGLEGASAQAGSSFNRQQMEATLAALGNRVFLMNNVHEDAPVVFHTRWAMSYLCGPLTRSQVKKLMDPVRSQFASAAADTGNQASGDKGVSPATSARDSSAAHRPILPAAIREKFVAVNERVPAGFRLEYRPGLWGKGKVHFIRKSDGVDVWRDCCVLQSMHETPPDDIWDGGHTYEQDLTTADSPEEGAQFASLPSELSREKSYNVFKRHLKEHLYREESLKLWKCATLDQVSKSEESEDEFRARLAPLVEAVLKSEREKAQKSHEAKLAEANARIERAKAKVSTQRWQFFARLGSTLWVIVDTVLSALGKGLPGRRRSLDPAFRSTVNERGQQTNALMTLDKENEAKQRLEKAYQGKLEELESRFQPAAIAIETIEMKPQKADVEVDDVSLVWLPWRIGPNGTAEPVY